MIKACVIGWPVEHSRSPLIHNYWLKQHGIAGHYDRVAVEPGVVRDFLSRLEENGFAGCNVTLPHKEAAFACVEAADEATKRLGVVNTVFLRNGRTFGTSTDGESFMANLAASAGVIPVRNERVVLLGAGGAAMAIAGALADAGAGEIAVANRTSERIKILRRKFGSVIVPVDWETRGAALAECRLLINTTALGMKGQPPLELDLARLGAEAIVADIVYTPLETTLLKAAVARGNRTAGGLGMLLHQAIRGFELWFGARPTVTPELYALVARDIDPGWLP
ncbi:MAG: shikimate dehydrogenase [Hyphomicrobiales bacterium]